MGATGGATLAFYIARYLASNGVEQRTTGIAKRLKEGVGQEDWRFVACTRLVPGKYVALLGINVYGPLACTGLYLLSVGMKALTARQRQTPSAVPEVRC